MAITRRLAIYVIVVAVLAVTIMLLLMAWVGSLTVPIMRLDDLDITDVQFSKDYLNITVENICTQAKIINKVTVNNFIAREGVHEGSFVINKTFTPYTVVVYEPVSVGEEISFRVSFKWTSGYAYEIRLYTPDERIGEGPAASHFTRAP